MAFDPAGEGGLRRRLNIATEVEGSMPTVATILNVPVAVLRAYLANPNYILPPIYLNNILANLADIPARTHIRDVGPRFRITFVEKPQWTQEDIDSLAPGPYISSAAVFFFSDDYPDDVETGGPESLETSTVQDVIDDAIAGNPDLLMTVVYYEPVVEYPYPGS